MHNTNVKFFRPRFAPLSVSHESLLRPGPQRTAAGARFRFTTVLFLCAVPLLHVSNERDDQLTSVGSRGAGRIRNENLTGSRVLESRSFLKA